MSRDMGVFLKPTSAGVERVAKAAEATNKAFAEATKSLKNIGEQLSQLVKNTAPPKNSKDDTYSKRNSSALQDWRDKLNAKRELARQERNNTSSGGSLLDSVLDMWPSGEGKTPKEGKAGKPRGAKGKGFGRVGKVGGALALGFGALEAYNVLTDDDKTASEKGLGVAKVGGGVAGGLAGGEAGGALGAMVGTAIAPGIGTAIGGGLGFVGGGILGALGGEEAVDAIGTSISKAVSDSGLGDVIGGAAAAVMAPFSEDARHSLKVNFGAKVDEFSKSVSDTTDALEKNTTELLTSFSKKLSDLGDMFGDGIGAARAAVSSAWASTKQHASQVAADVSTGAGAAYDKYVAPTAEKLKRGASAAYDEYVAPVAKNVGARWDEAKKYLSDAASKANVDPGIIAKIAHFESGFNSQAAPITKSGEKLSSAYGYGQFTDDTWKDTLNKYGAKYGVSGAGKLTQEQANAFRKDKTLQANMLAEFTGANITKGRALGGADDDANVYAFHNLGDGDATRMLKGMQANPNMSIREALTGGRNVSEKERQRIEKVIANNKSLYGDGNVSVSDAYKRQGAAMRSGDKYAKDIRGDKPDAKVSVAGNVDTSGQAPEKVTETTSKKAQAVKVAMQETPPAKSKAAKAKAAIAAKKTESADFDRGNSSFVERGDDDFDKGKASFADNGSVDFDKGNPSFKERGSDDFDTPSASSRFARQDIVPDWGQEASILSARQEPMRTVSASAPEEVSPVSVTNAEDIAPKNTRESLQTAAQANTVNMGTPSLDSMPLVINDMGLVLLNIGHI
jgi:hypothetical protein